MADPTPYYSSFSAAQVQETLLAVQYKVDKTAVTHAIPTDPTKITDPQIASLKLLAAELKKIDDFHKGSGLAQAVAAITDNNLFTDAHKTKLDKIGGSDLGVAVDIAQRDAKFPAAKYNTLAHGDYMLILADAGGYPSFQYWDITTQAWVDAYRSTGTTTTTITAAGTAEVAAFTRTAARSARYTVTATRGTVTQMWDVFVAHDGSGDAVYLDMAHEFKTPSSSSRLVTFTTSKSSDGTLIVLNATTTSTNIKIDVQRTALL